MYLSFSHGNTMQKQKQKKKNRTQKNFLPNRIVQSFNILQKA